uniref:Down syndrome cell adhesion molecule n=1 Tax=Cacopsylla melanoneura TaxID=428564 RepID=A0A8D8Z5T0_9HEMI
MIPGILVPPKIQPFSFGEEAREAGDSVSSVCQLIGDLPMNISWLMNGRLIPGGAGSQAEEESSDISVSQTGRRMSMLAIEAVKHTLAGNYTCFAVNQAGNASYSAELKVNG